MPDMKKELEREEIHRAIWAIADDLRGSVDGWDFKAYVLCMMFYRFISENLSGYIEAEEIEAGNAGFRYAELSDEDAEEAREDMINVKGFFILPSELFESVLKTASEHVGEGTANDLNMIVERVLNHIEESAQGHISEGEFKGLFDDFDVNSNKLGSTVTKRNERLYRLMQGIANMRLGDYKLSTVDGFGDAYEYLMTMYASNAGKSGGEFFTPPEVSDLLTFLSVDGKTEVNKVYEIFYPWKEQECPVTAKGFVQPYADSPMDEENVGEHVYQHILNNAKKYVYINTPYLIVDDSMLSALRLAAKSGVDIRIITPHRWDKWWVHMTTRSYYCIRRRPAAAGAEQNGRGAV